ncbi:unnamed protein product [Peronospora belbahrii]|uniref:PTM/DIR17-like Tudor domain-containing protein n=1 Tax=Peronospora belbahrii TaxID=622444 RepID=A0AAU9KUG2_9STRA|nr:unnamed protein product [Peronospora belbahrii]CAH0513954.1 unnamed protein product [Peronospora belbahrii]
MSEEKEDIGEEVENEDPSPLLSSTDQQHVRIMFHGREIIAEDLIGLRVAKTFPGNGRFLGQVVKFDKSMALYTVVYADGDAEDLTVDNTLQILIQDEIERADPSQVPPAISLLSKKDGSLPASPDTEDFVTSPAATPQRHPSVLQRHAQSIQVSEREAQFVISLFENHALPTLVRQGWRVQTSNSGRGETCFISARGEIFQSALDVVGHIALNNELLTSCFPANVHSAILSLLPCEAAVDSTSFADTGNSHELTGSTLRKRTILDSPDAGRYDGKRTRQMCDEASGVVVPMHAAAVRGSDVMHYRHDNTDRRAEPANRFPTYHRQEMGGRIRMSSDRFFEGEATNEARMQASPRLRGYRGASGRDLTLENPFSSNWSGVEPMPGRAEPAEYSHRFFNTPEWREPDDTFASDCHLEERCCNRIRGELRYIRRPNSQISADATSVNATGTRKGYYRDSVGSPHGSHATPVTNGFAYPSYSALRAEASDGNRTSATSRASRNTASFMSPTDTLGASAAFSMVDFDRISTTRPGNAHAD